MTTKFKKEGLQTFNYSLSDFQTSSIPWSAYQKGTYAQGTNFDQKLVQKWQQAQTLEGAFTYTFTREQCKYRLIDTTASGLDGPLVAQLNNLRGLKKRTRPDFETISEKFNENGFQFKKIHENEILFVMKYRAGKSEKASPYFIDRDGHGESSNSTETVSSCQNYLIVNAAPIEFVHTLMVSELEKGRNQIMTQLALRNALDLLLLSNLPNFRVMFNSIWAWASINHLHVHTFYQDHMNGGDVMSVQDQNPIFVSDFAQVDQSEQLKISRTVDEKVYCPAFCWDNLVTSQESSHWLNSNLAIQQVVQFCDYLIEKSIPHNIMILYHGVTNRPRIIVWPRKSAKGFQPHPGFDSAVVGKGVLGVAAKSRVLNFSENFRFSRPEKFPLISFFFSIGTWRSFAL